MGYIDATQLARLAEACGNHYGPYMRRALEEDAE